MFIDSAEAVLKQNSGAAEDFSDPDADIIIELNGFRSELAIGIFAVIIAASILLSLAFGQSIRQFSVTEDDFSFTGVGIGSALLSILLASIIEEVGCKGCCEDSIGSYMNWFWESVIFGELWSHRHLPLIFIQGTCQADLPHTNKPMK